MLQEVDRFLSGLEKTAWELRAFSDGARAAGLKSARLSATGWMLARVAADYRFFAIYSAFLGAGRRASLLERIHRRSARAFYKTSAQQRGAFLKVGQMLSARRDLLPTSWVEELEGLQDDAPAEPFEALREVIEADLGAPLAERFASFDEEPIAAASIGQVHRAVTLDGVEVAVKVQRPGIAELVDHDLELLALFLEAMRGMLPPADYATITDEVKRMVRGELDYAGEAARMAEMAALFDGTAGVIVPRPIPPLCGPRVLTATFIRGEKITAALDRAEPAEQARLLGTLLEVYLKQVLEAGGFQADPHPGNFLVTERGELALLDFGCVKSLPPERRAAYQALARAFFFDDQPRLVELFAELGFATQSGRPDTLLAFARAMLQTLRRGVGEGGAVWPTREQLLSDGAELLAAAERDPVISMPADFVMLARVFGTLGGLFQHYRPAIDWSKILPYLSIA
jgi:ubiquinone biosynthesis protein